MEGLPVDIIFDILYLLPMKSLMRCRCVSKTWYNLTRDPRFLRLHLHRSTPNLFLTNTMWLDGDRFLSEIHYLQHEPTSNNYTCSLVRFSLPREFEEFRVVGSCDRLVCLVDRYRTRPAAFICDPFAGFYMKLPDDVMQGAPAGPKIVLGFGISPKSNSYKTVVITHLNSTESAAYVWTFGNRYWRHVTKIPCLLAPNTLSCTVNDSLHWVCSFPANVIVSFSLDDEVPATMPLPEAIKTPVVFALAGCLSVSSLLHLDLIEIWVMKEYGVEDSWTKCYQINIFDVGGFRPQVFQKQGESLMLYDNRGLYSFSTVTGSLNKISVEGLPDWFEAVTHVGTL